MNLVWAWLVIAVVSWVPLARFATSRGGLPHDGTDLFVIILFSAMAACIWPLMLLAGATYASRRQIECVFVGKPRRSRSALERRICELEREVEL